MSDELLPAHPLAEDIPREFIYELAKGLEDPDVIARRYDIAESTWNTWKTWPPLKLAIEKARHQLDAEGLTFKYDAKVKAEVLSDRLFKRAISEDATPTQIRDALEYYTAIADLKPKQVTTGGAGSGFSVQIVLTPPTNPVPTPLTDTTPAVVDVTPVEKADEA